MYHTTGNFVLIDNVWWNADLDVPANFSHAIIDLYDKELKTCSVISLHTNKVHSFYDQPALIYKNGVVMYCANGNLHRKNGPAYINESIKDYRWYLNGVLHRKDAGPYFLRHKEIIGWRINGEDIGRDIQQWITANDYPPYEEWDDNMKVLFKLQFGVDL